MSINIITAFGTMGSRAAADFTRLNKSNEEIKRNTIIITFELRPLESTDLPMEGWIHYPINVGISSATAEKINANPMRNLAIKKYYPDGVNIKSTNDGGAGDPKQGLISFRIKRKEAERQIDLAMNNIADLPGAAGLSDDDAEIVHWTNIVGIGGSTAIQCLEIMPYIRTKLSWIKNVRNRLFAMTPHLLDSNNDRPIKLINALDRAIELDKFYKDGSVWLPEFVYIYDGAATDGCRVSNPAQSIPMAVARYITQLTLHSIGEQARGQHVNILAQMDLVSDKVMQSRFSRGIAGEIRFPAPEIIQAENALTGAKAIEFICTDGNNDPSLDPIGNINLIPMDESAKTSWRFGSVMNRARTYFNIAGLGAMKCADIVARHSNKINSAENEIRVDLPTAMSMAETSARQTGDNIINILKASIIDGSIGLSRAEARIDEAIKKLDGENTAITASKTIESGKISAASERIKATKVMVNSGVDVNIDEWEEEQEQSGILHQLIRLFDSIKTIVVNIFSRGKAVEEKTETQSMRSKDDDLRKAKVELFDKSSDFYVSRITIDFYETKSRYLTTLIAHLSAFKAECRKQRERLTRVKDKLEYISQQHPFISQDDKSSLVLYKDGYTDRIFNENNGIENARTIASLVRTLGIINFTNQIQGDAQIRSLVMRSVNNADYFGFLRTATLWGEAIRFFGTEEEAQHKLNFFIERFKPMAIIDDEFETISQLPNREAIPNVYVAIANDDQSPIRNMVNRYLMPENGSINYIDGNPYELQVISERHRYPIYCFRSIVEGLEKQHESQEGDEVISSIADEWDEMLEQFQNDGANHSADEAVIHGQDAEKSDHVAESDNSGGTIETETVSEVSP